MSEPEAPQGQPAAKRPITSSSPQEKPGLLEEDDRVSGSQDQARTPARVLGRAARFQFRLTHLFYAVTVLGVSMATFEAFPYGLFFGIWAVVAWASVLAEQRPPTRVELAVILVVSAILIALMVPAVGEVPQTSAGRECRTKLAQIGIALQNYHQRYGSYPPAFVAAADGTPQHSWRVLLLPFLGEQTLYEAYDFRQPWDSPHNRQLGDKMPDVYRCEGDDRQTRRQARTPFQAVLGPHAAWNGAAPRRQADFTESLNETLVVLETDPLDVPWLEPRDLTVAEALHLLTTADPQSVGGHRRQDFFSSRYYGRSWLRADGGTGSVGYALEEGRATELLSIDSRSYRRYRSHGLRGTYFPDPRHAYGRWIRLALFVGLILLPLPWARKAWRLGNVFDMQARTD